MKESRRLTLPGLAMTAAASLALALGLSACENVATYVQPSLVRVIDASYIAPAVDVEVENEVIAANIGQGAITPYGTLPASNNAYIQVTAATGGVALVTSNGTLLPGHQHSVFLTDNGAAPTSYEVTVLEDQQIPAAAGHSAFRFLNQAPKTGAVDVYMIPAGTTLANTIPLVTGPARGRYGRLHQLHLADGHHGHHAHRPDHAQVHFHAPGSDRRRSADGADRGYPVDQQSAR